MNYFLMETKYHIVAESVALLAISAIVTLVFGIRAFRHRHEETLFYDQMPAYSIWLTGTIVSLIIAAVLYLGNFTQVAMVNKTACMSKQRDELTRLCYKEHNLGCPKMWKQYRTDSLWLESMLDKFKD